MSDPSIRRRPQTAPAVPLESVASALRTPAGAAAPAPPTADERREAALDDLISRQDLRHGAARRGRRQGSRQPRSSGNRIGGPIPARRQQGRIVSDTSVRRVPATFQEFEVDVRDWMAFRVERQRAQHLVQTSPSLREVYDAARAAGSSTVRVEATFRWEGSRVSALSFTRLAPTPPVSVTPESVIEEIAPSVPEYSPESLARGQRNWLDNALLAGQLAAGATARVIPGVGVAAMVLNFVRFARTLERSDQIAMYGVTLRGAREAVADVRASASAPEQPLSSARLQAAATERSRQQPLPEAVLDDAYAPDRVRSAARVGYGRVVEGANQFVAEQLPVWRTEFEARTGRPATPAETRQAQTLLRQRFADYTQYTLLYLHEHRLDDTPAARLRP